MGRWIGVDYGTRHIGVAIADPGATIASPSTTRPASGIAPEDARRIVDQPPRNAVHRLVVVLL